MGTDHKEGILEDAVSFIGTAATDLFIWNGVIAQSGGNEFLTMEEFEFVMADYLEGRIPDHNLPISGSVILSKSLEYYRGRLEEAIQLTANVLAFLSRDNSGHDLEKYGLVTNSMQNIILDEYSTFVTYHQLPEEEMIDPRKLSPEKLHRVTMGRNRQAKNNERIYFDYSLPNQLGVPYHAFNIVALLSEMDPEIIAVMTAGEYSKHGYEQGMTKLLSDLDTLKILYPIKHYLEHFPSQET